MNKARRRPKGTSQQMQWVEYSFAKGWVKKRAWAKKINLSRGCLWSVHKHTPNNAQDVHEHVYAPWGQVSEYGMKGQFLGARTSGKRLKFLGTQPKEKSKRQVFRKFVVRSLKTTFMPFFNSESMLQKFQKKIAKNQVLSAQFSGEDSFLGGEGIHIPPKSANLLLILPCDIHLWQRIAMTQQKNDLQKKKLETECI